MTNPVNPNNANLNLLTSLPPELNETIYSSLETGDLINVSQVCKETRANTNAFAQRLFDQPEDPTLPRPSAFRNTLRLVKTHHPTASLEEVGRGLAGNHYNPAVKPVSQAAYVEESYNKTYNIFWNALQQSQDGLPDLEGAVAISNWLKDPNNSDILKQITILRINEPDLTFLPPEALTALTNLQELDCSQCTSLVTLNTQSLVNLRKLTCTGCTSLVTLNAQGLLHLQELICSGCTSLVTLNTQGLVNLQWLTCPGCTSLVALNTQDLVNLQWLNCNGCTSLETLITQDLVNLQKLFCNECTSLKTLNTQGLLNLQGLDCSMCTSLETLIIQGLLHLEWLDCYECTSLETLNAQGLLNLQRFERSGCTSLKTLTTQGLLNLQRFERSGCTSLQGPS